MDPFHAIYISLFIFGIVYFVMVKPTIDGFSVAFGGMAFYFLPALLGRGMGPLGPYSISPVVYFFSCLLVISLIIGDRALPQIRFELKNQDEKSIPIQVHIMTSMTIVVFLAFLIQVDLSWIGAPKSNIKTPFTGNILRYLLPIGFLGAWIHRDWRYLPIITGQLLFYTVLTQVRSPVAMAFIGAFLYELHRRDLNVLRRLWIGGIAILTGFLIILFGKVSGHLLKGNINILFDIRRNLNQIIWNNNGHTIFQTLNNVLHHKFKLSDPGGHLVVNFFQIIPFAETLLGVSSEKFSTIIGPIFYPGVGHGAGSNIWAETYAIGGLVGLCIATLFFLLGLAFLSAQLDSRTWNIQLFAISLLPYWGFFNYRLTLGAILSTTSLIAIICFSPIALVRACHRIGASQPA